MNEKNELLSPKQLQCLALLKNGGLKRINILEGSVRSGKTYVSLILWGFWAATMPQTASLIMVGKTLTTLRRNVLVPLTEIFGTDNFVYSLSRKEGRLFGRTVYLEGVCDSRSESKIRGLTLDGAYCDELTLFEEDFFTMLLSRLSTKGAKLIGTTNPDHPNHWLKRKYLDNAEIELNDLKFNIDDNIFLDKEYVRNLKREYKGMYYERFILGNWVAAEGGIYRDFTEKMILPHNEICKKLNDNVLLFTSVGVDFGGNKSASVFAIVGFDAGFENVYALDEYYDSKNKSAEHLINKFTEYIEKWRDEYTNIRAAYCDSAEQLLVKSFRSAVCLEVKNARKKPINTRINMVCRLQSSGRFFISEKCVHLINALETAVWDESKLTSDVRLDNGTSDIDSLDAFEYAIERFEKDLFKV